MLAAAVWCLLPVAAAWNAAVPSLRATTPASTGAVMSGDLDTLANELNPVLGFWDPLNLADLNFWGQGDDATAGFLRHAEIKHGRVAMAGFVGFIVQSMGIKFPYAPFDAISGDINPAAQWDALSEEAKWQIILFVGFLEVYSEHSFILEREGQKHYMRGGKPGYYPTFSTMVHPVPLNLWDPFGITAKMSPERKASALLAEINNGRMAMFGIMGFIAASKVPGSVPGLEGVLADKMYDGNVMAPFDANFHLDLWFP